MDVVELRAGPDQVLIVYQPLDTGGELDALEVFSAVAADAERRAANGEWVVSMTTMPLRHSAVAFGREGSGFETKIAVVVVYGRIGKPGGPVGA